MILKLKRTPGIYLVGFMGSGKTTVGRLLASNLGWTFADLDGDIEAAQQITIPEIFDTLGEAEFRRLETEAIRKRVSTVACGHPLVVALGGGAFARDENYSLVSPHGISIWLDLPIEILKRRVARSTHRPLARDMEAFEKLFWARREAYARADFRVEVPVDDSAWAVERILELGLL
jgi:shikimate kinase